eukprot:gene7922-biopygen14420
MVLGFESPLDGRQLVVESNAFFFETAHDLFVCPADTVGLVVLDHGFIQSVFQHSNFLNIFCRMSELGAITRLLPVRCPCGIATNWPEYTTTTSVCSWQAQFPHYRLY